MRRVLVIGSPGAGKTSLATAIARLCSLPAIHLDLYRYAEGWVPSDEQFWVRSIIDLGKSPEWVMDGYYPSTFKHYLPRADTLIWIDLPRSVCMLRCLRRSLRHFGRIRPDLPNGRRELFPDLLPVWNFPEKERPCILEAIERFGRKLRVIRLRSSREIDALVTALERYPESLEALSKMVLPKQRIGI